MLRSITGERKGEAQADMWDENLHISNVAKSGSPVLKDEDSLWSRNIMCGLLVRIHGELGLGDTSQRRRFTELPSQLYLHNQIVSLGAGNEHSCVRDQEG